jgi:hypothetical protein
MKLHITIDGPIDSLMLWELIKDYKPNLTDIGKKIYVYGEFSQTVALKIIGRCQLFGDCEIRLSKGGQE